jgi:uncharacterized protein YceH (UPF0502 family)
MSTVLTEIEVRVLGSLIEKQLTTPEYYPLTLNSLVLACNQKSNRQPVSSYTEDQVSVALESLRLKNLAYVFYGSNNRVPKYKHVVPENFDLKPGETAVLAVLMLRGWQTPGELRGRTERMYVFTSLEELDQTLHGLMQRDTPLVTMLPRQPGQKEARFAHLLMGEIPADALAEAAASASSRTTSPGSDRIAALESELATVREELNGLRSEFEVFRQQFT